MIVFRVPRIWGDLLSILDLRFTGRAPDQVAIDCPTAYRLDNREILDKESGIRLLLSSGGTNYFVFFEQEHDYTEADHFIHIGVQEIELNNCTYQVLLEWE